MKVVIKVGTQSILASDGTPCDEVMRHLVEQIAVAQKNGHHVVLVSSGAVGSGRKVAEELLGFEFGSSLGEKQVLASLGQHELMHVYARLFKAENLLASQLLLTKQDFQSRHHYLNIARLLQVILERRTIIPIINENDSVAIEELMFTDNDELAGLIAAQINADLLVILTNVDGVFTGHPEHFDSKLIPLIQTEADWPTVTPHKTLHGRGGMLSKLSTARKMSSLGITTHIANINIPSVISRLLAGEAIGTKIIPRKKKSNIKRWMAYNSDKKMGSIVINPGLQHILSEGTRAVSILPVGIIRCDGAFRKSDLIEILTNDGQSIGLGIAQYDANKLADYLGQKDKPEFIHYNQLHLY